MVQAYDIYLNGVGYMLAKGQNGDVRGAFRSQATDPLIRTIGSAELLERAAFQFEEGAGQREWNGSKKYRWGLNVDSRSGKLIRGPDWGTGTITALEQRVKDPADIVDEWIGTNAVLPGAYTRGSRFAFQVTLAAVRYRSLGLLMRRDPALSYAAAPNFTIRVETDAAGVPSGVLADPAMTINVDPRVTPELWQPLEDRWLSGQYFWMNLSFGTAVAALAGGTYWVVVTNEGANNVVVSWGRDESGDAGTTGTVSFYPPGGPWNAAVVDGRPYLKMHNSWNNVDREVNCFCEYRVAADNIRRLFAGVGPKLMQNDGTSDAWTNTLNGDFATKITDMIVWNGYLCVGFGNAAGYQRWAGGAWTVEAEHAYCWGIHNNMLWRANEHYLYATTDNSWPGLNWSGVLCRVGDAGTPVQAIMSHGGSLYVAKPEGIYEVEWDDDFPGTDAGVGTGEARAHLIMDFSTDVATRPFLLDWQAGLYFPSSGGLYEYKGGLLQNIWQLYVDDEAEVWPSADPARPTTWVGCCGTTHGLLLSRAGPTDALGQYWWYDHSEWVPLFTRGYYYEPQGPCWVSSIGAGKGYAYLAYGFGICRVPWALWTDTFYLDPSCRFNNNSTVHVTLPTFDGGRPDLKKDFYAIQLTGDELHRYATVAGHTYGGRVRASYSIDGGAWATLTGAVFEGGYFDVATQVFTPSPVQRILLPTGTTGYRIDIMLELFAADAASVPPVFGPPFVPETPPTIPPTNGLDTTTQRLKELTLFYQSLPETMRQFQIAIADRQNVPLHEGAVDLRSPQTIGWNLLQLLEVDEPVVFTDTTGVNHNVRVVGVSVEDTRWQMSSGPGTGMQMEKQIVVTLLKLYDTLPGSTGVPGTWGVWETA